MKDLTNHHIGHGEPLRHADEDLPEEIIETAIGCIAQVGAFVIALFICALITMCCTGCSRTIIEERPVYVHDTLTTVQLRVDSVLHHDSIYVETFMRGDTVFLTKYTERWHDRIKLRTDTIREVKEIPVTITKTEVKEVPAKLTKWQRFAQGLGNMTFFLSIAAVAVYLWRKFGR